MATTLHRAGPCGSLVRIRHRCLCRFCLAFCYKDDSVNAEPKMTAKLDSLPACISLRLLQKYFVNLLP